MRFETDRPRIHWIDPEMARVQEAIDRTFPARTNLILGGSRDGNRLLVWSSAADDPGTYYVYDRARAADGRFRKPLSKGSTA